MTDTSEYAALHAALEAILDKSARAEGYDCLIWPSELRAILATHPAPDERDPADYGSPNPDDAEPETTICRTCDRPAIEHTKGRFSIYGICPATDERDNRIRAEERERIAALAAPTKNPYWVSVRKSALDLPEPAAPSIAAHPAPDATEVG